MMVDSIGCNATFLRMRVVHGLGRIPQTIMEVDVMSVKPMIKCNCGQRIVARDVMQTGYYLRLFGPSFVYVKFRCSRCKKLGEQFIKQEDWEDGILKDIPSEVKLPEKETFQSLGPISITEQVDFHFGLDAENPLAQLAELMELDKQQNADTEESEKKK